MSASRDWIFFLSSRRDVFCTAANSFLVSHADLHRKKISCRTEFTKHNGLSRVGHNRLQLQDRKDAATIAPAFGLTTI
jgi:hypothetical protein